jgi:hypothetical protein
MRCAVSKSGARKKMREMTVKWKVSPMCSRKGCQWAAEYYARKREEGKSHACALRCLGQRWLKILWRIWQNRTPYDDHSHAERLARRLMPIALQTTNS